MLRAFGIALLALAPCACSKTAPKSLPPATVTPPKIVAAPGALPEPSASLPKTLPNALDIGSQDAKDDLYCSGVIFNRYAPTSDALSPTEEAIRMRNQGVGMIIAQHGADMLMAEGVARVTQLGEIADAYGEKTAKDIRAGNTRIGLESCIKRAEALPKPAQ